MSRLALSRKDPAVRRLRAARDGREPSLLFLEGIRPAQEAVRRGLAREHAVTEKFLLSGKASTLLGRLEVAGPRHILSEDAMAFASDLDAPPGLIVLAEAKRAPLDATLAASTLVVALDGLQIPTNAGAVIRAAAGAGADAVISIAGGTDPFGPKALRGAAGTSLGLPIVPGVSREDVQRALSEHSFTAAVAEADGNTSYLEWDFRRKTCLVMGSEAAGPAEWPGAERLRIPMAKGVESLNVAVAAGVLLFEAARQRRA